MNGSIAFLRFVTKAALNYVGFGVAGDFLAEALPEMARDVYAWWGKGRSQEQLRAEVQALALIDDEEARRQAADAVAAEAEFQPEVAAIIPHFLSGAGARRRPRDAAPPRRSQWPNGAASLSFNRTHRRPGAAAGAHAALPQGAARPGFGDWVLDELLGVGGFGEVWKATNPHLPPVALKFCLDPDHGAASCATRPTCSAGSSARASTPASSPCSTPPWKAIRRA